MRDRLVGSPAVEAMARLLWALASFGRSLSAASYGSTALRGTSGVGEACSRVVIRLGVVGLRRIASRHCSLASGKAPLRRAPTRVVMAFGELGTDA